MKKHRWWADYLTNSSIQDNKKKKVQENEREQQTWEEEEGRDITAKTTRYFKQAINIFPGSNRIRSVAQVKAVGKKEREEENYALWAKRHANQKIFILLLPILPLSLNLPYKRYDPSRHLTTRLAREREWEKGGVVSNRLVALFEIGDTRCEHKIEARPAKKKDERKRAAR